mmetsp:Transcript_142486/g.455454  ORF Transcript_142486/g.455454 Transcript_142486/m.455454 type:complete len:267 (-) Transcript_142486:342-1142(-)
MERVGRCIVFAPAHATGIFRLVHGDRGELFFVEFDGKVLQRVLQLLLPTRRRGSQDVHPLLKLLVQGLRRGEHNVPRLVRMRHRTLHHGCEALQVDPALLVGRQRAPGAEGALGHRDWRDVGRPAGTARRTPPEPGLVPLGVLLSQPPFGLLHIIQRVHRHAPDAVHAVEWCHFRHRLLIHMHHVDAAVEINESDTVQVKQEGLVVDAVAGHALRGHIDVEHGVGLEVDQGEGAEGLGEVGLHLRSPLALSRSEGSLRHTQEVAEQ